MLAGPCSFLEALAENPFLWPFWLLKDTLHSKAGDPLPLSSKPAVLHLSDHFSIITTHSPHSKVVSFKGLDWTHMYDPGSSPCLPVFNILTSAKSLCNVRWLSYSSWELGCGHLLVGHYSAYKRLRYLWDRIVHEHFLHYLKISIVSLEKNHIEFLPS